MKIRKKFDIGNYTILAVFDDSNGSIDVGVYDELNTLIEAISISDLKEDDINPNLN